MYIIKKLKLRKQSSIPPIPNQLPQFKIDYKKIRSCIHCAFLKIIFFSNTKPTKL